VIPILFDPHPRPNLHPKGAAFISFLDEDGAINYLSSLFQIDEALEESRTWDESLLAQHTAHILKLEAVTPAEAEQPFPKADIEGKLAPQQTIDRVKAERAKAERAKAKRATLRDELWDLRCEVEQLSAGYEQMPVEVQHRMGGTPSRKLSRYVALCICELD
jgi:hypothetical protein